LVDIRVSVNMSSLPFVRQNIPLSIQKILHKTGLSAEFLELEITETVIMENSNEISSTLLKLKEMGVTLAVDDFGTGYSSLHHLKELPVSELKIDKSFILNMTANDNDAVIVRSTIDMAHNLGLTVVAEGIEEKDTYDILEILRCDYGQGYLLNKPLSEEDLIDQLQSGNLKRASQ